MDAFPTVAGENHKLLSRCEPEAAVLWGTQTDPETPPAFPDKTYHSYSAPSARSSGSGTEYGWESRLLADTLVQPAGSQQGVNSTVPNTCSG